MQRLWRQIRNRSAQAGAPRGMTLVEIMIVITIMASIMGVVGFYVFGTLNTAKKKQARMAISKLKDTVNSYALMKSTHNEIPDSLDALTEKPNPLIQGKSELNDPWGNKYIYEKNSNQDFVIYSAGADGQRGTKDDVYPANSDRGQ